MYGTKKKPCKCCLGTGVQYNKTTGIRQPCPYCYGTGNADEPKIRWQSSLDKLEVKIICDKPEQFLWVHDIVEGFVRLANQDVIITSDDIDPKFREAFGKYIKNLS